MKTDRPNDRTDLHDVSDPNDLDDLNFLREWREPIPRVRIAAAAVGAILYHLAAIAVVVAALNAPPPDFSGATSDQRRPMTTGIDMSPNANITKTSSPISGRK